MERKNSKLPSPGALVKVLFNYLPAELPFPTSTLCSMIVGILTADSTLSIQFFAKASIDFGMFTSTQLMCMGPIHVFTSTIEAEYQTKTLCRVVISTRPGSCSIFK